MINILYTLNDNFVPQIAAAICSVCESNKRHKLGFYLFSEGITAVNKEKLRDFVDRYNQEIHIIEIGDLKQYFDFEFDTLGWNSVILARLLMDKILPEDVERILYLDGDTIVIDDLEELWGSDMKECAIGACIEATVDQKRKLSMNMVDSPYYNSGVLLVNLKLAREKQVFKKVIEYYKENDGRLFAPDQDAINGALKDTIYTLSPKYNFANTYYFYPYQILCKICSPSKFVDKSVYDDAIAHPAIIHYLGEERPWRENNTHKFKKEYEQCALKTPWGLTIEEGWSTYFFVWNIFNHVFKFMPYLRYKVINNLIPLFMKYRKAQLKKG